MNLSRLFRFAALGALAACNGETSIEIAETGERPTVPAFFNCVRENDGLVIAAHRAGPAPGFPENAIETMENALSQGVYTFEIDVSTSRDGVLFLLHDRTLGRTTNISGRVADTDWDDIRDARLVDNDGATTAFTPPSLAQTLDWAVANNALLELDRKAPTTHDEIIEAVKRAGAQRHVVVITYTDAQARNVAELAPDLMMSASPDEDG
ncbi:MAG: glycerophosphodiester phosphodiesterase family protein, partial [Pseudomonadota bacterium]